VISSVVRFSLGVASAVLDCSALKLTYGDLFELMD